MADCALCDREHRRGSSECPGQRIGQTVAGKYRLLRLLGAGGMGAVYEAEHLALARRVALKMLHPKFSANSEVVGRFRKEAQRAAALGHPGIVDVRDLGQDDDGALYLEMELLVGESVADLVGRGPAPIGRAVDLVLEALDALAAAHAQEIVHRDLKPENLFVVGEGRGAGRVKILDFGIAKAACDVTEGEVTRTGSFLGTPVYMSPEQLRDSKRVDARSDLYSMGATLLALLTGRPPVEGSSLSEVIARVLQDEVVRDPRVRRPETPAWLGAVVERALARLPEARFASAREMMAALEAGRADLAPSGARSLAVPSPGEPAIPLPSLAGPTIPLGPLAPRAPEAPRVGALSRRSPSGGKLKIATGWTLVVFGLLAFASECDDAVSGRSRRPVMGVVMILAMTLGGGALVRAGRRVRRESVGGGDAEGLAMTNQVLRIAKGHAGRITAAEIAAETAIGFEAARGELERLHRAGACEIVVGEAGIRVFHFPEFESAAAKKDVV